MLGFYHKSGNKAQASLGKRGERFSGLDDDGTCDQSSPSSFYRARKHGALGFLFLVVLALYFSVTGTKEDATNRNV